MGSKVAIVTGAARGLGRAYARRLAGLGAKIAYYFWRRYEFTMDREWLRARAYPMIKGAAEFVWNATRHPLHAADLLRSMHKSGRGRHTRPLG